MKRNVSFALLLFFVNLGKDLKTKIICLASARHALKEHQHIFGRPDKGRDL